MKQHITVEQLNELSDKGREKLRKWWKPEASDKAYNTEAKKEVVIDASHQVSVETYGKVSWYVFLPLLSIGQMIEFLGKNCLCNFSDEEQKWHIAISKRETKKRIRISHFFKDELCDALWEAVKKVLK